MIIFNIKNTIIINCFYSNVYKNKIILYSISILKNIIINNLSKKTVYDIRYQIVQSFIINYLETYSLLNSIIY